jgi:molybdenum cofactor cytidylyltransferase
MVISRIACGLTVTHADIAGMGIGGLLKEIPTRPMPRAGRGSDKSQSRGSDKSQTRDTP